MTSAQRTKIRKLLLALETEFIAQGRQKIEPMRTLDDSVAETKEDEQPLSEMLQAIASTRNRSIENELVRARKALKKLKENPEAFGECEECGDEIPFARLRAMPYAEFCVNCQGRRDAPKAGPTRRKLTEFI